MDCSEVIFIWFRKMWKMVLVGGCLRDLIGRDRVILMWSGERDREEILVGWI